MRHRAAATALERQPRLSAIERLDLALLVHREDHGVCRRIDVEADDIAQLGREVGIVGQLELAQPVRLKAGRPPDALHRTDAESLIPTALAIASAVQWVVSPGGGSIVSATTRSAISGASGGLRDGRVLSRSPSTASCIKRSCQRQTAALATPASRMISAVPQPSIRARQACFCGLLRSTAMAASRSRSAGETWTVHRVGSKAAHIASTTAAADLRAADGVASCSVHLVSSRIGFQWNAGAPQPDPVHKSKIRRLVARLHKIPIRCGIAEVWCADAPGLISLD